MSDEQSVGVKIWLWVEVILNDSVSMSCPLLTEETAL